MKKTVILLLVLAGVSFLFIPAGCKKAQPSPTPLITAAPTAAPPLITPAPTPAPVRTTAAPTPTARPTPLITPTPSPAATPVPTPAAAPLSLAVASPAAESIVKEGTITVRGKTSPDAVVTVDNKIVDVDENGNFSASVTLTEGINIIEVLASDLTGSAKGQVLTVIYTP